MHPSKGLYSLFSKKKSNSLYPTAQLIWGSGGGAGAVCNRGMFLDFFMYSMYFIHYCLICRPADSNVSGDVGIQPRIVATSALAVRRSSHSVTSHTSSQLHLIHYTRLHLNHYSATSHPLLGYISSNTRLHLIHYSATSHPLLGYIASTTRRHLNHYPAASDLHFDESLERRTILTCFSRGCMMEI